MVLHLCPAWDRQKITPGAKMVKIVICTSNLMIFLLFLVIYSPSDKFKYNWNALVPYVCHHLSFCLLDWWLTSAWKWWSLLTKKEKNYCSSKLVLTSVRWILLCAKMFFGFFSKSTFSEATICLAETDKGPKMTHPGFVFCCLTCCPERVHCYFLKQER